jgi:serine O-acetyltransferase
VTHVVTSLAPAELASLAAMQCNNVFPDGKAVTADMLAPAVKKALERLEHCFSNVNNKYFFDGQRAVFNHLHGDQYAMWLYFLANELYRQGGPESVCSKLFLLNKSLFGCDIFYEVALPDIFLLVHPLGTVLGRGAYSDYFVAYQRCGVGSNHDVYPSFGEYVTLRPGSAVLGNSKIGDNCQIAAEALVIDRDLPDNSLYIGNPKTAVVKPQLSHYPLWRN